jgi:tetratricopeptide (TPR) repeat protein
VNHQLAKQYFERAEALLDAGKPSEALPLLDQLNDAFPNTKNILFARAKTYAALGRTTDALHACDALIEQHRSKRAAALKQQLIDQAHHPPQPASQKKVRRFSLRRLVAALVLVFAGAVAFTAYSWPTVEEFEPSAQPGPERVARTPAPPPEPAPPRPGRVHVPIAWERDDRGVPVWRAGIFRNVPCVNAPERTIDVYVPMAYDAKPDAQFPGVLISMAGGNPGFIGLEDWAERQEVVLVGLNSSRNGPAANNIEAQEAAFATIIPSLRVDQRLGFAIGMSGGAMASWLAVYRNPDNFRGLVMMGQSGYFDYPLAPHIRVAYIRGRNEPSNRYIERMIGNLRANGNLVRDEMVEGAHVMGPVSRRVAMLNWMVHAAREDLELPQPGE